MRKFYLCSVSVFDPYYDRILEIVSDLSVFEFEEKDQRLLIYLNL